MEDLLSQRLKNIIFIAFVGVALITYLVFIKPPGLDRENIYKFALESINAVEKNWSSRVLITRTGRERYSGITGLKTFRIPG